MKVILVHADDGPGMKARLAAARLLAQRRGGHVTILVSSPFQRFVAMDPFGGAYLAAEAFTQAKARDAALLARLAEEMAGAEVSWDIVSVESEAVSALAGAASVADIVLVALSPAGSALHSPMLAGDVALAARVPVLALPEDGADFAPQGPVLVAWNGSAEAAAALRAAMPLLADRNVTVLRVGPDEGQLSDQAALSYLARHGINAVMKVADSGNESASRVIEQESVRIKATLIVMGAFGHSRLRETVFGGATRDLLKSATVPLLLAH